MTIAVARHDVAGDRPVLLTAAQVARDPQARATRDVAVAVLDHWHERFGWAPPADGSHGLALYLDSPQTAGADYLSPPAGGDLAGWHQVRFGSELVATVYGRKVDLASPAGDPQITAHELTHLVQYVSGAMRDNDLTPFQDVVRAGQEGTADALAAAYSGSWRVGESRMRPASATAYLRNPQDPADARAATRLLTSTAEVQRAFDDGRPLDSYAISGLLSVPAAHIAADAEVGLPAMEELVFRTITESGIHDTSPTSLGAALVDTSERMWPGANGTVRRQVVRDALDGVGLLNPAD